MKTFRSGGVHPSDNKLSRTIPVDPLPLPDTVQVAMRQHLGEPAVPCVAKGDRVLTGQLIGQAPCALSAHVHAPVSGVVQAVDMQPDGQGLLQLTVTIDREGDEWAPEIDRTPKVIRECALEPAQIIERIRQAGIVGLGGATFPTAVKLTIPASKHIDALVINGAECEPYLTSDHRVMLERAEEVMVGISLVMRALGVDKAQVGIEANKPDAIASLQGLAPGFPGVEIVPLKVRYPQGGEKQLAQAVTGRQIPPPPGLPMDVGVVIVNISTALAVYEAVQKRKPLIERVVTVTGRLVPSPRNLLVRLGTPVSALLQAAGVAETDDERKILSGGPMMGRAISHPEAPVTKGCSGITLIEGPDVRRTAQGSCLKCSKCVQACPMGLQPYLLMKLSRAKMWDRLETEWVASCIECGCCQFTCPATIPLLDFIRLGKYEVRALMRERAADKHKHRLI